MIVKMASPELSGYHLEQALPADVVVELFDHTLPLVEQIAGAEVLIPRSIPITKEAIDAAPKLKLIQRPGAKVYVVDMEYAAEKSIPVCVVPIEEQPSGGVAVAEHTLFLMLAVNIRFKESQRAVQTGSFDFPGIRQLEGQTLGVIGVGGRIGRQLVPRALGLGLRVIGTDLQANAQLQSELAIDWLGAPDQLQELLCQSDIVTIHIPLTQGTQGYVGQQEIGWMKDSAILINTARAPIVEYGALYAALSSGRLAGAGLGVWWSVPPDSEDPLLNLDNVIVVPHVGTVESARELAGVMASNIISIRDGKRPHHIMNM